MMVGRLRYNTTRHYVGKDIDYIGNEFLYTLCGSDHSTHDISIMDAQLGATCKKCVKKYNKTLDNKNKELQNDVRTI